jgi:hypothetical protein
MVVFFFCCRATVSGFPFECNLDLLIADDDPFDEFPEDSAGFRAPDVRGRGGGQIVSR